VLGVSMVMILFAALLVGGQETQVLPTSPSAQESLTVSPTQLYEITGRRTSTITPKSSSTVTSKPSATYTLTPTRMPELVVTHDAYCYVGPGDVYGVVNTLRKGSIARVIGRGEAGYWVISVPFRLGVRCWISSSFVEADRSANALPLVYSPPKPSRTPTPTPLKPHRNLP
jgi:hypothetical protein